MKAQDQIFAAFNPQLSLFEVENEFTPSKKVVPIKGFEERYTISEDGDVFCMKHNRFINPHFSGTKRNYHQVSLVKKGQRITKKIHSLMAVSFLGFEYGNRKIVIDHIDNDPRNNSLSNLQIISQRLNCIKDRKPRVEY